MFTLSRRAWQDSKVPVVGPSFRAENVNTVVVHYTADKNIPQDVAQYLRNIQSAYTKGRGYSVGYNCAVDQRGRSWELRGFDFKCAANKDANNYSFAILMLVDGDDRATPAALAEARRVVGLVNGVVKKKCRVVGHFQVGATACPGSGLKQDLADGLFDVEKVDEMATLVRMAGYQNVWLIGCGPALNVDGVLYQSLTGRGVPVVDVSYHEQMLKGLLTQSAMSKRDLVRA
jgi:hypothetical protein